MLDQNSTSDNGTVYAPEIDNKLLTAVAAEPITANTKELYKALSIVAREQLARRWVKTQVDDRKTRHGASITCPWNSWLDGLSTTLSALDLREKAEAAFSTTGGPLSPTSLNANRMPRSATAVLEPPRGMLPRFDGHAGTAFLGLCATNTACLRSRSSMAPRSNTPIPGSSTAPWEFPVPVPFSGAFWRHRRAPRRMGRVERRRGRRGARAFDYVIPGHGTDRVSTLRFGRPAPRHRLT